MKQLVDIQASLDQRGITIQEVGIKDLVVPLNICAKDGDTQLVHANIALTVELSHDQKGIHMSRLVEVFNDGWMQRTIKGACLNKLLEDVMKRSKAEAAAVQMDFKYFVPRTAPVSGLKSMLDVDCGFRGRLNGDSYQFTLRVNVPITTLCPCSKAISDYGAHNQRGMIKVQLRFRPDTFLWIEDVVETMEQFGSCPLYPLLKRDDEKWVTERAYNNPRFVEDVLREAILYLRGDDMVVWYDVLVENYESIHNHNAYARHSEEK